MAEGIVQLPVDGAGKKLRTQELVVAGATVEQEVVTLADADGTLVSLGQRTRAASLPVTLSSEDMTALTASELVPFAHDRIDATYPSATTEAYAYKSGGVTVATVTVTYTDSTKASLSSIVRT